jgi:hypothetical protein
MTPKITLDDRTLERLRRDGEVKVQEVNGLPLVVMTTDARQQLQKLIYDDSDWTADEMRTVTTQWLDDPEGWGAPGMEIYDELYGDKSIDHGEGA